MLLIYNIFPVANTTLSVTSQEFKNLPTESLAVTLVQQNYNK